MTTAQPLTGSLIQLQAQMISFLTDNDQSAHSIADHIVDQGAVDKQTRLLIYKNAYQARLKEVIDTDHNILGHYLGDELFNQMTTAYIQDHPSRFTSLRDYADQLPPFLQRHKPFSDHPIISEIARFERLLLSAFDAPEAPRIDLPTINRIPATDWPTMTFNFHPSVQLVSFAYNAVESWQALKTQTTPDPATAKSSHWLLWRNEQRLTEFRSLSPEENTLITMLLNGEDFSAICTFLLTAHSPQTVANVALNYLSQWVEQGILRNSLVRHVA